MKRLVPIIAKALFPLSVRDRVRPYWQLLGRKREISKVGPAARWAGAQSEEIDFWDKVLNGELWPEVRPTRTDPAMPLQEYLVKLIDAPPGARVRILDVGAGPLTFLGKKWPGRDVAIIAVDPNAGEFDRLLAKHGIEPPCRTTFGFAEELSTVVPSACFDLVHARNCLDHSRDPLKAIREMVEVVKPGGYVFLNHKISEGKTEGYTGPHQWNFFPQRGRFFIERPGMRAVDVGAITLRGIADVTVGPSPDGPEWFVAMIKRSHQ